MKNVMTKVIIFTLAVLMITAAVALPAFAEEVGTEAITEEISEVAAETEEISDTAADLTETEKSAEKTTDADTFPNEQTEYVTDTNVGSTEPAETETAIPFDQWLYDAIKQATPEQVEMIEEIVMGGLNALDKLGIKGFDRVRIWVEYNTATVMVIALAVALVLFFIGSILQKKGFAKKADLLNSNAIEMYNEGQAMAEEAHKSCKAYADRADRVCRECAEAAQAAAESAKAANGQVSEERALLIAELDKSARVNQAMCETVDFLLQCSDLSQAKRDEAHAIYQRGVDALRGYIEDLPEELSKEVMADENNDQA